MFGFLSRKRPAFDPKALSIRLLADVTIVDPQPNLDFSDNEIPPQRFVGREFLPGIAAQVVCAGQIEGTLQWLTADNIKDWGVSEGELFDLAIQNLNQIHVPQTQLNKRVLLEGGTVYWVEQSSVMKSSLLLADALWADFGFDKETIAAAVPDREWLLFCDRHSVESLSGLQTLAESLWDDPEAMKKYRISKDLLVAEQAASAGWTVLTAGAMPQ
ncbi:hypothetical protein RB623_26990 [Mesorhizobium sp. LHD-90]|uniref:hypothetical protein n=1 Tax=Mesorhizobium sp. LHD-90 TaxID=3071414 RepID=UPI0027DF0159|nr:hypothetical protein [Mesorhizobium sp. LHD-90]MDQ6437714.1 hypothetical protein [Mesorhizobium sp. LHD-90]